MIKIPKISPYYLRLDQISRSVMSDSLRPHESQHASLPVHQPIRRMYRSWSQTPYLSSLQLSWKTLPQKPSGVHVFWAVDVFSPWQSPCNKRCTFLHQTPVSVDWLCCASDKQTQDSVQFSRSVVSDSLRPRESQHARPPCPSQTPRVHSDSHPSSQWCHPAISSSGIPFSSCPQFFPASESFPVSQLFAWGGQSTGVSASVSFPPKKSQGWSPSEWTGWISLQSKGLARVFCNTTVQKHQFFGAQPSDTLSDMSWWWSGDLLHTRWGILYSDFGRI